MRLSQPGLRAGRRKQLAADLEHADQVGDLFGELDGRGQRVKVQGDDQAASGMGVEGLGHGIDPDLAGVTDPFVVTASIPGEPG